MPYEHSLNLKAAHISSRRGVRLSPTVQGEGALAGVPTYFVRFGGCDYRCSWCDSLYAVLPAEVRKAPKHTSSEIVSQLAALVDGPNWVTLSGGNPALLHLEWFVEELHDAGLQIAVETQGSRWKGWLSQVDCLTVSPKPPSSGMATDEHAEETHRFMVRATSSLPPTNRSIKIVVFDEADYQWAKSFIEEWPFWDAYLSVGTDQPDPQFAHLKATHREALVKIGDRYRWLCEKVSTDPALRHVRVLPQLHVLAWGHSKGV